jgi:uncharacterized protein (DUF2147 family)
MKSSIVALAAASLMLAAPAMAASPIGIWKSPSREARIEILACAVDNICGRLLTATRPKSNPELLDIHNKDPGQRGKTMIGQVVFDGFRGGPSKWTGGRVYNPGDGNYYKGVITLLDDDHLTLKGCALVFLCKSQTWERVQ